MQRVERHRHGAALLDRGRMAGDRAGERERGRRHEGDGPAGSRVGSREGECREEEKRRRDLENPATPPPGREHGADVHRIQRADASEGGDELRGESKAGGDDERRGAEHGELPHALPGCRKQCAREVVTGHPRAR